MSLNVRSVNFIAGVLTDQHLCKILYRPFRNEEKPAILLLFDRMVETMSRPKIVVVPHTIMVCPSLVISEPGDLSLTATANRQVLFKITSNFFRSFQLITRMHNFHKI